MNFSLIYSSKKNYLLKQRHCYYIHSNTMSTAIRWNYFLLKNTPYDTVFFSSQIQI